MEIALQAPSLLVAGADDPATRGAELVELAHEVAVEPVALHRDPEHRDEGTRELRRLEQPGPVEERADLPTLVLDGVTTAPGTGAGSAGTPSTSTYRRHSQSHQ